MTEMDLPGRVELKMILCNAAEVDLAKGTLHMLGGGWSHWRGALGTHALAVILRVPWDRVEQDIPFALALFDGDGQPVLMENDDGGIQPLQVISSVRAIRSEGLAPGSPQTVVSSVTFPPMPLLPGRYEYRIRIDGVEQLESFEVVATADWPTRP